MRQIFFLVIFALLGACGKTQSHDSSPPTVDEVEQGASADQVSEDPGWVLYGQFCLSCHQSNGGGVPNMQPGLVGSPLLAGDPDSLIKFMLTGERSVATPPGTWLGVMAQFDGLSDEELATLLSWMRTQFVTAPVITPDDVARVRANIAG